jgi:hypothetical protein
LTKTGRQHIERPVGLRAFDKIRGRDIAEVYGLRMSRGYDSAWKRLDLGVPEPLYFRCGLFWRANAGAHGRACHAVKSIITISHH